ncbi:hypothetical protein AB0D04_29165 [Streptomyces sp. NPDC048483]|uniref:hypothetical protein n=1 Tax=Streptomyces sp. NPDC048483 TaxID=3154927 RepID=UPI00341330C4
MATRIPRHDFRTDNTAELMEPVVAAAQDAMEGIEASEDDRFDALTFPLSAAEWQSVHLPFRNGAAPRLAWSV